MLEHSLSSPVLCCLIISSHLLSFWAAVENILMSVRCLNVEWWKSLISQLDFSETATTPCRLYAIDCTDAFFSLLTLKERCNRQTTLCIVTTKYLWIITTEPTSLKSHTSSFFSDCSLFLDVWCSKSSVNLFEDCFRWVKQGRNTWVWFFP